MAGEIVVGIKRQGLLFLPDGNLPDAGLEDILRFTAANGIVRILADIPGEEELPEQYGRLGFCRAYLYRCYQREQEEKSSKEQEEKSSKEQEEKSSKEQEEKSSKEQED